ncbi:ParB/RepB/Spo0J family partition protein [Burkholderia stagnalis]|uniref:ParB/RepB/Spo0J family partition protein n=1 Tax=Burkholderia stagnalis TaxID=1503054 RepID=UPI000F5BEBE1|nr:ParB/RepB/Spo0J family partition protein [Burkholderia stagnalis]TCW78871.1 chromosome partitioning protein ParB [Burkholderia sp. SRS-46]RQP98857.1 ParB/RepB/Spo0J family partition protein [Burkholderia stagnalis]RQX90177.1 ParB/RepB/Spo0J family partition protein [Burkholderia stagnalis]RQY33388.1 ParB/RepB/Spo0J family partition protein [Burkholderia stagnalis]RQY56664.1 ParB/RepB/Spo0J family partition protein [Burkholderia stagnalis]
MSSLRERMMSKTADLRPAKDIPLEQQPDKPTSPRTAPGMAAALATVQKRVLELEKGNGSSELPIAEIVPNPWQPRRVFNEAKLTELAESIREAGLIQPIVVRRAASGYQIVAGERRWRAHKMIGRDTIKVVIVDLSDEDMAMLALVENVVRDGLTDYEVSRSIRETEKEFPNRKRMAEALGISRSELYRYLAFADLPGFVVKDLDIQPRLLGANAAEQVVSVLRNRERRAFEIAQELWSQVVAGDLDQTKLAKTIKHAIESDGKAGALSDRNIEKIFAGKNQAGSITKDAGGFTVKIKAGMLTAEKEEKIRALIAQLFAPNE